MNRKAVWIDYPDLVSGKMPNSDWVCLATSSESQPNFEAFDKFVRESVKNGLLEFKGHGTYGEKLHDWFDDIMSIMHVMESHKEIEIMTTWHNNQTLADAFWQCFGATCLPDEVDFDNITIVCTDLDDINRETELRTFLQRFEEGWLP